MKKLVLTAVLLGLGIPGVQADAVQPATTPLSNLAAAVASLEPGSFLWYPEISPEGPVTVVVSLTEQKAYVYRNGIAIGVSTVSTGKKGKETPTGVFTILQKKVTHHSNLYNNSPMPYMQRLTWDGIALHAGNLPGYPASHGCIRLPMDFAKKLYSVTGFSNTTVVISDAHSSPVEVYHPGLLAPMISDGKAVVARHDDSAPYWNDPGAEEGPLSILVSRADRRAYIYRGGQQIGTAPVELADPVAHTGVAAFSLLQKPTPEQVNSDYPSLRWTTVQVTDPDEGLTPEQQLGKVNVDPVFLREILAAMDIGTMLVITDLPSTREMQSQSDFTVIATKPTDGNASEQ